MIRGHRIGPSQTSFDLRSTNPYLWCHKVSTRGLYYTPTSVMIALKVSSETSGYSEFNVVRCSLVHHTVGFRSWLHTDRKQFSFGFSQSLPSVHTLFSLFVGTKQIWPAQDLYSSFLRILRNSAVFSIKHLVQCYASTIH